MTLSQTSEIRPCRVADIFDDPARAALFDEYAKECLVADAEPQKDIYAGMERAGALQCFGAYVAGELAGFVSVATCVMPHNGKRVATIESIFVSSSDRSSGAGNDLLSAAERYAEESGCVVVLCTARIGSRLQAVLSRRARYGQTHIVYSMWLS